MRRLSLFVLLIAAASSIAQDAPRDRRFDKPIDYNGYFPDGVFSFNFWKNRRQLPTLSAILERVAAPTA